MVRVGTVVVAVREDLNDVLALHGIPSGIDEALALEFRIGVVVVVLLLEKEVFVFDVVDGREFRAAVVVVENVPVFVNLLQIGAEAVVDDLDAGGDQSVVAGLEEVVIREEDRSWCRPCRRCWPNKTRIPKPRRACRRRRGYQHRRRRNPCHDCR